MIFSFVYFMFRELIVITVAQCMYGISILSIIVNTMLCTCRLSYPFSIVQSLYRVLMTYQYSYFAFISTVHTLVDGNGEVLCRP